MNSLQDLELYYQYLYPYQAIVDWLTYKGTRSLSHRELSFQYESEAVQRYVVFNDANAMRERMTSRFEQIPIKVDAGAIWGQIPKKDSLGKTIERELIFDFDMNDYDDVRNCCQGKTVCKRCWKLLVVAIEVIRVTLQEDYDLHNFMYVFSGGRGVHIWVCDERARKLKDSVRRALVDYLELVHGNQKADSMLTQNVLKPIQKFIGLFGNNKNLVYDRDALKKYYIQHYLPYHVQRSLQILEKENFLQIFKEQQALEREKGRIIVLKILKSRSQKLMQRVAQRWENSPNETLELFRVMIEEVKLYEQVNITNKTTMEYPLEKIPKIAEYKNLTFIEEEIMLTFLYPRMDYNVSTSQNHLLKLPFSIHPSSHKVSVPIFPINVRQFDPASRSIKFQTLMEELKDVSQKCKFIFKKDKTQNLSRENAMLESPLNTYIRAMRDFIEEVSKKEQIKNEKGSQ